VDEMVERNLAILREKKRQSLFELMTNKRAVNFILRKPQFFAGITNPQKSRRA
jgi:hypothetical protein